MVYNWLKYTLSGVTGRHCLLCFHSSDNLLSDFCPECLNDLPIVRQACQQCGVSLESEHLSLCGSCITEPPSYDRVISAYGYARPIRQLMASFKFQHQLSLAPIFARALLAEIQRPDSRIEAILPVPLHPIRLRQRGFNQALELARPIAAAYQKPMLIKSIHRNRNTETQSNLPAKLRENNLRGAFELTQAVNYRGVAIIDDVMTTGSTANELAKTLKLNGVNYVEVWCAARAHPKSNN
ncbi:Competence protein F homolog, phosphoribosyltransferase domain; protein YhgH required for utilization of DNA as sole source of carbon and energy [hydrothermal vent metagenome]|uniref:Competence protein F homolog, phosphoribosyltransferase domain protein YhgH required for utilization of DNA as sole source of carbon and energy n=1 Tax=hydrothermal vent metagenome TaxID=652676 RepID=A0A3B1A272_9ZZZZ